MKTAETARRPFLRRFTLIELVVVLAILVILAAGIVAKLDILQLRANKGVAASDMSSASRLIQTYMVANNHYPDGYDSLCANDGAATTLWTAAALGDLGLDPQLTGSPVAGSPTKLITTTIGTNSELRSLTRMGINQVYDADTSGGAITGVFPSNAFNQVRALAVGGTYATINGADGDGAAIIDQLYPQTAPNGGTLPDTTKKLAVFGIGPRCTLVGRSGMTQEAPLYANNSDRTKYYGRYLAIFEVDTGGGRARFLGAFGGDADRLDEELQEYYELQ